MDLLEQWLEAEIGLRQAGGVDDVFLFGEVLKVNILEGFRVWNLSQYKLPKPPR